MSFLDWPAREKKTWGIQGLFAIPIHDCLSFIFLLLVTTDGWGEKRGMERWDDTNSDAPLFCSKKQVYDISRIQQKCFVCNAIADVDVLGWMALSKLPWEQLSLCDRRKLWVKHWGGRGASAWEIRIRKVGAGLDHGSWIMGGGVGDSH